MPFPEYIATRTLSAGGAATIESNRQLKIRATLQSTKSLVWSDTGFQFLQWKDVKVSALGTEVTFNPPRTDLAGWKDYDTKAVIDVSAEGSFSHRYLLLIEYLDENDAPIGIPPQNLGPFALPDGVGTYDVDKSVVVGTVAGDQVSIPDLWSQLVADAEAAAAAAQAAIVDSAEFVGAQISTPGTPARVSLETTFVSVEGVPTDGDAIVWDEAGEQWVPAAVDGGGSALTVLSEAEGNTGTATTARAISAARLVQQIQQHAVSTIPNAVVRSVIVTTGTEPRPTGADLVVWIDLDNEGTPNADTTDIVFTGQSFSVPPGGTLDQVLAKASGADGDTYWRTVDGGGGGGGSLIMPVGKGMQFVPWDNTLGNLGFQNGAVNLIPVYVKQEVTFNKLLLMTVNNDAVDATGRIVAGIYSVASGQPGGAGTLLYTFEDRAITGVTDENWFKFGTTDYTIPPGLYYLAFLPYNFTGLPDGWRTGGRGQWDTTISYGVGHFDPGDSWLGNPARTVRYVMDGTGLSALPTNTTALSAQSSNDPLIPAAWIVPS